MSVKQWIEYLKLPSDEYTGMLEDDGWYVCYAKAKTIIINNY